MKEVLGVAVVLMIAFVKGQDLNREFSHCQLLDHSDCAFESTIAACCVAISQANVAGCLCNKSIAIDYWKDFASTQCVDPPLNLSCPSSKVAVAGNSERSNSTYVLFGGLACLFLCPCFHPKRKNAGEISKEISCDTSQSVSTSIVSSPSALDEAVTFTMAELNKMTANFSQRNKIGVGAFGTIYKGKLPDGTLVAVKRAKRDSFSTRHTTEFQNEVKMLSNIEHLNLVKLVGFLEQGRERILVVEYVPNGNLREHLDGVHGVVLSFSTRLDIAIDVAHALTYLHEYSGSDKPMIHRDVKASNILLTDTFRAKVADFGFSRAGPEGDATHVSTQVKGTAGYLDPEYLQTYQLTTKSDVFSFGILLIEILSARRPIELRRPSKERITVRWAFTKVSEGEIEEILDPNLRVKSSSALVNAMEKVAQIAFDCAAPTKGERPRMKEAAEGLRNIRQDFQSSISQSTTPRELSLDYQHHPLPSNILLSPRYK